MAGKPKKDCNCHTSLSPLYATVTASGNTNEARARVHMRGSIIVETSDGPRRLMPAEEIDLAYSLIATILQESTSLLYFDRATDKERFLLLFPEYSGRI